MARIKDNFGSQVDFPGGSRTRINRAGDAIRNNSATALDFAAIDIWRAAHRHVLNTFQGILRNRTRQTNIIVAQRHKRRQTIFGKLDRYPKMSLSRMDDVAGCRLIFPTIAALNAFREKLHKANFDHTLRNDVDKWDYLKHPKDTGYRGIHDVYEYDVRSEYGRFYRGLLIEVQYRTQAQHAWATCVEVVGFVTSSQPKFQQGDKRYERIMSLSSELIARAIENANSCHPNLTDVKLVSAFLQLDQELGFMNLLRGLNSADSQITDRKNVILMFTGANLETRSYRDSLDAVRALFALEKERPGSDVVLVRADSSDEVRIAFRNYFKDATDFIDLVDRSCAKLGGVKALKPVKKITKS